MGQLKKKKKKKKKKKFERFYAERTRSRKICPRWWCVIVCLRVPAGFSQGESGEHTETQRHTEQHRDIQIQTNWASP